MAPSSATTSVQVALRIRPPTNQDSTSIPARFQRSVIQATSPNSVSIEVSANSPSASGSGPSASAASGSAPKKQNFSFDQVHNPSTTQHALFTTTAEPLVSRFLEGFNCTILAYGQTSSGKTFTMTGIDLDADPSDPNNGMGIIPRAVSTIFTRGRQLKEERGGAWNFSVKGSFIEIYNEDLIDLLSTDDAGARREVQIREDKEGHIIWGGLREVSVKNSSEVMTLIRKGTSIRRTNETDMNAQSSRSHAIFSLTLTQKKFVGGGAPPRSSSPLPPNGRSSSRLARPGSMYSGPTSPTGTNGSRMASPTFGRPATPSFAAAMGRGGGLRPQSAMGLHTSSASLGGDEESGEWVTIVSKFHFVDLAGSERLKRTAAAGERIKEGIAINGGLLALGNVISALGDPARAKTATHVPYRDSKLTRLLQDSLGGNAHTLMIACVSPAEWNAGETVNTLKYANRARNIKNRAVVNEKEDGWDDIDWLQGQVNRLRKELKVLKDGGVVPVSAPSAESEPAETNSGKRVLAQMTELQNNYEDLREKFVERTEELTRLRRELGEKQRNSSTGAIGGTAKYEEIVGPVIEEYEKTIAAMEAELNLNRAALRMTNEMVEEKEEELAAITERHAATELYVEELRARTAKLTEREASTEAYVRDLEEKMKSHDENSITSSESMLDLKREVSRFRDTDAHSTKYIADLEARLAKSDESILSLQQTVERLEKDSERRREEAVLLQERLTSLTNDGNNWRSDLEERERKVMELELKMEEWERKKTEAGEARVRLGGVVGEVASARRSLQLDLQNDEDNATVEVASDESTPNQLTEPLLSSRSPSPTQQDPQSESQLLALQQTHTATLADLASVTSKYRDALREIADLAAQIQEAKLSNAEAPEPVSVVEEKLAEIPPFGRRLTGSRSRDLTADQVNPAGKRLFFRQAASAESLQARSLSQSQSLSQELSSVRTRKASSSSHGASSSVSSHSSHSPSFSPAHRPNLSISISPTIQTSGINSSSARSVLSLENEIMRLQDVLKEREAEISSLELSLKETSNNNKARVILNETPVVEEVEEDEKPAVNGNGHIAAQNYLSPATLNQFDDIRKSMENGNTGDYSVATSDVSVSETDESLDRLNELMLSMAQKESQHREVVDDLNGQLAQVRRQHDALTTLSRDQAINMSTEIESLQSKHAEDLGKLEAAEKHENELLETLNRAVETHAAEVAELRAQHATALEAKAAQMDLLVARLKEEHETHLTSELSKAAAALNKSHKEHEEAFGKLKASHDSELRRQLKEAEDLLESTREQSEVTLKKAISEHEEALKQQDAASAANVQRLEEEYYNALTKLRENNADVLNKQTVESLAAQERIREEHAAELRIAEKAREGSLSESQSARDVALKELQDGHAASIARKEASFVEQLDGMKAEHARALSTKDDDYRLQLDRLRTQHEGALARLKEERRVEVDGLTSTLATVTADTVSATSSAKRASEKAMESFREQQAAVLEEITHGHDEDLTALKSSHATELQEAVTKAEKERTLLVQSHTEEVLKSKTEHQQAITDLNAKLMAAEQHHLEVLEQMREQSKAQLAESQSSLEATLAGLQKDHSAELETMHKDHELLVEELETHKCVAEEATVAREETKQAHVADLSRHSAIIGDMQKELAESSTERESLRSQLAKLRHELDSTRSEQSKLIQEASKRESLVGELERHRSELAEMHESLEKVKDEKDNLQLEKTRQETMLRELQAQIARSASPPGMRGGMPDRNLSYTRATGLPSMKLPPPTPPPSVPPPPAPRSMHHENGVSVSSQGSSGILSSSSSRESTLDSPITSTGGYANGNDSQTTIKIEQQAKHIDEQDAMIKTLNKQLTHCESDLQTHMDLVATLETSLGDSEKNLRKARMHATEIARERDTLNGKIDALRNELTEAKREVVTVRRSVVEEKQSLEQRLDEERKAKERARAQLDSRMEELQRRKSKFACL